MKIKFDILDIAKRIIYSPKYSKKLRPYKTLHCHFSGNSIYISFEMAPVNKYSRSHSFFAFEEIVQDLGDEIMLAINKNESRSSRTRYVGEVDAGSCDFGLTVSVKDSI